ncbi:MAG: hypothetical protein WBG73_21205 [Coleofasciculaceae cyanobacterium]
MNSVWLKKRFFQAALTISLLGVASLFSTVFGVGNDLIANAAALTPEATEYQVNGNPYQAEQEAGKENFQNSANKLFEQNKNPQEAPELTQKIGEALTKPAKSTKQNIEGIAGNVQEAADTVKDEAASAYEEQRNKPKSDAKDVFENIKEKLNLDQPIYPGTKEFINDVEEKAEDTIKGTQQAVKNAVD